MINLNDLTDAIEQEFECHRDGLGWQRLPAQNLVFYRFHGTRYRGENYEYVMEVAVAWPLITKGTVEDVIKAIKARDAQEGHCNTEVKNPYDVNSVIVILDDYHTLIHWPHKNHLLEPIG